MIGLSEIIVDLKTAVICFMGVCHPALVGDSTPTGKFQIVHYSTLTEGYGGDILVFKEDETQVWAIHRIIKDSKKNRLWRIRSYRIQDRTNVTNGCINVEEKVYNEIVKCCANGRVIIK